MKKFILFLAIAIGLTSVVQAAPALNIKNTSEFNSFQGPRKPPMKKHHRRHHKKHHHKKMVHK